ncbi:hypothetical protein ACFSX5_03190 [Devosia albogilva]|uniref:Uncharacterized protein n=1 Tax=Devosia albogilva TaxID=429726 RepID=A0ABW5QHH4_9HYPH
MPAIRFPLPALILMTTLPAAMIGATLWVVSDLVPACTITEETRSTAPDGQFDLVTFSRRCGDDTPANIQAALVPPGEPIPDDAASFFSLAADADLQPRWDAYGNVELTLPEGAEPLRQDDTVAGINVVYR